MSFVIVYTYALLVYCMGRGLLHSQMGGAWVDLIIHLSTLYLNIRTKHVYTGTHVNTVSTLAISEHYQFLCDEQFPLRNSISRSRNYLLELG